MTNKNNRGNREFPPIFREIIESVENPTERAMMELLFSLGGISSGKPPDTLSHYTTFEGMAGMLQHRRFWATEVGYLNDSTEPTYGPGAIKEEIIQIQSKYPHSKEISLFCQGAMEYLQHRQEDLGKFVVCFCEEADLLSMWNYYAGRGGGFCLEFDSRRIRGLGTSLVGDFVKVLYGKEDLGEHPILLAVRKLCDVLAIQKHADPSPESLGPIAASFVELLFQGLKDPGFACEKEWRVIRRQGVSLSCDGIKFRSGAFSVKPYIEIHLPDEEGLIQDEPPKFLPLKRIIVGPTLRPAETVRAVQWMLKGLGYKETVPVEASKIPLQN